MGLTTRALILLAAAGHMAMASDPYAAYFFDHNKKSCKGRNIKMFYSVSSRAACHRACYKHDKCTKASYSSNMRSCKLFDDTTCLQLGYSPMGWSTSLNVCKDAGCRICNSEGEECKKCTDGTSPEGLCPQPAVIVGFKDRQVARYQAVVTDTPTSSPTAESTYIEPTSEPTPPSTVLEPTPEPTAGAGSGGGSSAPASDVPAPIEWVKSDGACRDIHETTGRRNDRGTNHKFHRVSDLAACKEKCAKDDKCHGLASPHVKTETHDATWCETYTLKDGKGDGNKKFTCYMKPDFAASTETSGLRTMTNHHRQRHSRRHRGNI